MQTLPLAGTTKNRLLEASEPFVAITDQEGTATIQITGVDIPVATRPAAVTVDVTAYDLSGLVGGRSLALPVSDGKGWIGLAKAPSLHTNPETGKVAMDLDIVRLTADNKPDRQHMLEVSLKREQETYSWEVRDGSPQYTRSVTLEPTQFRREFSTSQLRGENIDAATLKPSDCVQPERMEDLFENIDVGRYVLTVEDKDTGRVATIRVQVGAAQTDPDQLEPNIFVLSSDKEAYQPNETIELTAQTPFDGPVLVGLAQGDVKHWVAGHAENGVAKFRFAPPAEWAGKGFYALATVFRASDKSGAAVGPNRAIGAKYIEIAGQLKDFAASVAVLSPRTLESLAPGEDLKFRLCVSRNANADCAQDAASLGAEIAEDVYAIAYVVDEGLIGLTGHHSPPPDPKAHFYGRRRLDVRIMDNYSRMLVIAGGDRPGRLALSNYTSDSIVALADGPVKVQRGRTEFTFRNPGLVNGRLSIFVIVWSKNFASSASADVQAQSPVVGDLGAPRFLLAGDRAVIPLRLVNFSFAHNGDFNIRITTDGQPAHVSLEGSSEDKAGDSNFQLRTPLPLRGTKMAYVVVEPEATSRGPLKLSIDIDPVGSEIPLRGRLRTWQLDIRPPRLSSVATLSFPLQDSPTSISQFVGDYVTTHYADPSQVLVSALFADSAQTLLSAAPTAAPSTSTRTLDELVTRALTFFGNHAHATDAAARPEGEKLLGDILSLQLLDGSFVAYRTIGLQSPSELNQSTTTEAVKTTLRRTAGVLEIFALAKEAGYPVPSRSISDARKFASSTLSGNASNEDVPCSFEALLTNLALVDFGGVDQAQIDKITACPSEDTSSKAIAYAITSRFGSSDKAQILLANFVDDVKQGGLKNLSGSEEGQVKLAMILNFLSEGGAPIPTREFVAEALLPTKENPRPLSPTATAWIPKTLPTERSTLKFSDIKLEGALKGVLRVGPHGEVETPSVPFPSLQASPTLVSLAGGGRARAFITIEGVVKDGKDEETLPPGTTRRRIYSAKDGHEINPKTDELKIGDQLVIVVEGDRSRLASILGTGGDGEPANLEEPIVLADLLPSAFTVVSGNVRDRKEFKTPDWTKKLEPIGDLRSIVTDDSDRWVALVVPQSRKTPPPDEQAGSEGVPAPAKPNASKGTADTNFDFRQAYLVRVNLAGRFVWPGLSMEGSTQFASTYRSEFDHFRGQGFRGGRQVIWVRALAGVFTQFSLALLALAGAAHALVSATPLPDFSRFAQRSQLVTAINGEPLWAFLAHDGRWRFSVESRTSIQSI